MTTATAIQTIADLVRYHRELVRTQKNFALGRMKTIAIGPSRDWRPPAGDPYIAKYGRLIELRDRMLPIAQSGDSSDSQILVTNALRDERGQVKLPDLPDPDWQRPALLREEIEGGKAVETIVEGRKVTHYVPIERDPARDRPPMIPQRLTDRCEQAGGEPAVIEGTNFLLFQPVLRIVYQPEIANRLIGSAWNLDFTPDLEGKSATLLVDYKTGEMFFLYGRHDIFSAMGE
jgi:hypothetical protein